MLKKIIARIPILVELKRWAFAVWDITLGARNSYSQDGEDAYVARFLLSKQSTRNGFYVDVGANQPTRISNTYLFYRHGWHGIICEPNAALTRLQRRFRRRDIQIQIGCGATNAVLPFRYSYWSVLSSFSAEVSDDSGRRDWLPVMRLDCLLSNITNRPVDLLSIDVEGLDLDVLLGATETLRRTRFVIIEPGRRELEISHLLGNAGFRRVHRTKHNLIFAHRTELTDEVVAA